VKNSERSQSPPALAKKQKVTVTISKRMSAAQQQEHRKQILGKLANAREQAAKKTSVINIFSPKKSGKSQPAGTPKKSAKSQRSLTPENSDIDDVETPVAAPMKSPWKLSHLPENDGPLSLRRSSPVTLSFLRSSPNSEEKSTEHSDEHSNLDSNQHSKKGTPKRQLFSENDGK